jgi:signal transduction histidine kinase
VIRRLWSGLRTRVIMTYLIIFLVSAAIMAGRAGTLFAQTALTAAQHDLQVQAYLLASALGRAFFMRGPPDAAPGPGQVQALVSQFAEGTEAEFTIVDSQGSPIAWTSGSQPGNQRTRPEVASALLGRMRNDLRADSEDNNTQMIYAAAPIVHDGRVIGAVQVSVPASQVTARTQSFWLSLGLTAVLAALAAALAGWVLAGELVRPVERLRAAARRLAAGHLDERVPAKDTGGVTEIAQLAEAFNFMAGSIEETLNRQREFVANASHELRTPVTNIKLRAEQLGQGALGDPAVARRWVGEIESEANRLSRMAGDLLAMSRQDAGAPAFRELVDVNAVVEYVVEEMSLRAELEHVDLRADLAPVLPEVEADPIGLQTVLLNLVDNALQYTSEGGRISVRTELASPQDGQPRSLILTVSDTGRGIPPEDLPHIFERFYRVDKSHSRRMARATGDGAITGSGAGLGLAIVRGIVEEHGGTVTASSTLGVGTTMMIALPRTRARNERVQR